MTTTTTQPHTMLEAVIQSLERASRYVPGDAVPPAAVLWTDDDSQWLPLVEQLRPLMPTLLEYGEFEPAKRKGPAVWLRCVIEPDIRKREFPGLEWPVGGVPVIYLPGVSRQTLRAVEECPDELKPLVELQYRGTVWTQKNGRDWTLLAFLVSQDGGLGLDVAEDRATLEAMRGALGELAMTPLADLRNRKLEAVDFRNIVEPDSVRAVLTWLNAPAETRADWGDSRWSTFRSLCRDTYSFDPETDGEIVGAGKLGLRDGAWASVWDRFAESPSLYSGIPSLLRRTKPTELIFDKEPWPDENEAQENQLRQLMVGFQDMQPGAAREKVLDLDSEHAARRNWVWAKLGWCPLAQALEHLAALVHHSASPLHGESADALAEEYAQRGYLCDGAALSALACARSDSDAEAIRTTVRALYRQWLDESARSLQESLKESQLPAALEQQPIEATKGDCFVFVDGLRYDLGQRLSTMARTAGLEAAVTWRWAGVPTVTSTAKPVSSPVVASLKGESPGTDFNPVVAETNRTLNAERFRRLLEAEGLQLLEGNATGEPHAEGAVGWTECGQFDKVGHAFGTQLALHAESQLESVLERVRNLLIAGWGRVTVITDHGWLLLPGGLPKHDLPKYLTESRWPRFAAIKDSSAVQVPVAPWSWNTDHWFAYAPGICCFRKGEEYAHGGISPQECLIPVLTICSSKTSRPVEAAICKVSWRGMRCRVAIEPAAEGLTADLRTKPTVADSSVTNPKPFDSTGNASLVVDDDSMEGTMVSLVVVDAAGRVICQQATVVGEEP